MLIDGPEISIVAVDPGTTTGVAVYDGWSRRLFWDQWVGAEADFTRRLQKVKASLNPEILYARERVIVRRLVELLWAVGPHTLLVVEDFILGSDSGGRGGFGGRSGLSPVRIRFGLQLMLDVVGAFNGDLWRQKRCGLGGIDPRGAEVDEVGKIWYSMPMRERYWLTCRSRRLGFSVDECRAWGGDGIQYWDTQGAGDAKGVCTDERMRSWEWWIPGKDHATDALRHLRLAGKKLGKEFHCKPELLRVVEEPTEQA